VEREIDQLMNEQMVTLDYHKRKKLYDHVQQIIAEQLPFIFLATPNILAGAKGEIGNFQPALLDHYTLWNVDQLYLRNAESAGVRLKTAAKAQLERRKPSPASDERLVELCLKGNEQAWADLIDKYKNLIYSIPIKLGMFDDAADIFQSVCLDLLSDLPKLREPKALPKWLMQVAYHKCLEHRHRSKRQVPLEDEDAEKIPADDGASALPEEMLVQLQDEQMVRDAVSGLSPRCGRMVRMLFFEMPPRPYQDVAKDLGIATGSIGFIRGRCLGQLKKQLEKMGFL